MNSSLRPTKIQCRKLFSTPIWSPVVQESYKAEDVSQMCHICQKPRLNEIIWSENFTLPFCSYECFAQWISKKRDDDTFKIEIKMASLESSIEESRIEQEIVPLKKERLKIKADNPFSYMQDKIVETTPIFFQKFQPVNPPISWIRGTSTTPIVQICSFAPLVASNCLYKVQLIWLAMFYLPTTKVTTFYYHVKTNGSCLFHKWRSTWAILSLEKKRHNIGWIWRIHYL